MAQLNDWVWQVNATPIRPAAVLTNSYVAATVIQVRDAGHNQLVLYADFTIGSLTSASLKVEFSPNGSSGSYYQETFDNADIATGVITEVAATRKLTATGKYRITIPIKDPYIKVSAIGTGTVTSSTLTINACTGNA